VHLTFLWVKVFFKSLAKYTTKYTDIYDARWIWVDSLPKTGTLASVGSFAECILSDTRQRRLYRVAKMALPSVFFALGKDVFCRVPFFWHSAKCVFAECLFLHSAKRYFAVCIFFGPRQIIFSKQFLRPEMNSNEKLFNYKVA